MSDTDESRSTIQPGRNFEEEYRLEASEAGEFLIDLGEQLRDSDKLTLVGDEWELPFAFGQPIELEIEYEGVDDPELEIEIELPGRTEKSGPKIR